MVKTSTFKLCAVSNQCRLPQKVLQPRDNLLSDSDLLPSGHHKNVIKLYILKSIFLIAIQPKILKYDLDLDPSSLILGPLF